MSKIYDIIIIGAGTAGMTAAIYGQRAGKQVLLLEAGMYGGQIINSPKIENYPGISEISGYQFAMNLYEQATALGAELDSGRVTKLERAEENRYWLVHTEQEQYQGRSIIIATGVQNRKLGVPGEEAMIGRGISYCATCDGTFYKDKTVVVAGGGNTALGSAEYLAGICRQVYLIHRREQFRGAESMVRRLEQKENIIWLRNTEIRELVGTSHLERIRVVNVQTGEEQELAVDGVFVAVGKVPDNQIFQGLIELDAQGYIQAGEDCHTSKVGIYAAGDCRTKRVRQLTTAAADGAVAALAAIESIEESEK